MNTIQQKLLPLAENIDYHLRDSELTALPKTRLVDRIIHHPAIEQVLCERMEEVDGLFKLNKSAILVAGVPAYDETIQEEEVFFEYLPILEDLKMSCIPDITIAIAEFLSDKQNLIDQENDSINIVNGKIHTFNFKNIAQPNADTLLACYEAAIAKQATTEEKAVAHKLLQDTDYHILKAMELGVQASPEILAARAAARLKLQ